MKPCFLAVLPSFFLPFYASARFAVKTAPRRRPVPRWATSPKAISIVKMAIFPARLTVLISGAKNTPAKTDVITQNL